MLLFPASSTGTAASPLGAQLFPTARLHTEPLAFDQARAYVAAHHRHNDAPQGHVFSVGCYFDGVLVGVAIVGRPVARALDNGRTLEVTRVCTQGHRDACSKLYAACQQRARLRGYQLLITYTRRSESAASVRAANFELASGRAGAAHWSGRRQASRRSGATKQELKCRWQIRLQPVARTIPQTRRNGYEPLLSHQAKEGAPFDWLIYPGAEFMRHPGLPVPPFPAAELCKRVGGPLGGPSVEQWQQLHELAAQAGRAGFQLMLARLNPRFPFYLTTCRHGRPHRRSAIQWGATHLSPAERLQGYFAAVGKNGGKPKNKPCD